MNVVLVGFKCRSVSVMANWIEFYLYDEQERNMNLDEVHFIFLNEMT